MGQKKFDMWLGVFLGIFGLVTLLVWIPLDTDSGLIEKVRRQLKIGDALAPTLAATIITLSSFWLVFSSTRPSTPDHQSPSVNFGFVAKGLLVIVLAMLVMRWTGPLLVDEYRALRDTMPFKLLGYLAGGTILVSGLICLVERRLAMRSVLLGFVITLAIALVYDLPFEDLLLPPNGDV